MLFRPDHAFILAAGKGERLRPYTHKRPKPLVEVDGTEIIDYALDKLERSGVRHVTVNLHYMAEMLETHLSERKNPHISLSHEAELLDTGGGIKKALHMMGGNPFYVLSGDAIWSDSTVPALDRMAQFWDSDKMDLLLLLQPLSAMHLTKGVGDYDLDEEGRAIRSLTKEGCAMWTSIRICSPALFEDSPEGPFSFLQLMDRAQQRGRLFGMMHDADWHHISTPEDLERVNTHFHALRRRV